MAFRTAVAGAVVGLFAYTLALYVSARAERRAATARPRDVESQEAVRTDDLPEGPMQAQVARLIQHAREAAAVVDESRRMAARGLEREAAARLIRQLEATPDDAQVLATLGELLLSQGDGDGAVRRLVRALTAQPRLPHMRLRLGQALYLRGDYEAALDVAAWALEMEPNELEAHRLAARAALRIDAPDLALLHLRRILDLQGDDLEAWQTLPVAYLRRGEYGRAIQTINEIIRQNRAVPGDYFNLSVAFAQQGQVEDTVEALGSAALRFEAGVVHPWLAEPDFDPIRSDPRFRALEQQLARNLSAAPTALRPGTPRADQAVGLLPEPDFLDRPIELRAR